jgi:hypothetical protein
MIIICCLPSLPLEIFWHLLTPLQRSICAYSTTRDRPAQLAAVLGQEPSDWLRCCAMLSSVCMSRAGLDGKWPDTQFHLTTKRMEPSGSGATWTGSPKGVFAGRKHHKLRQVVANRLASHVSAGADTIKVSRTLPAEIRMKFLNERFVPARCSTTWQH